MTPIDHSHDGRTMVAAIMFADLVGYSKRPVTDQVAAKEAFRGLLQAALAPIGPEDRIVVDTGDGAAIGFLADPEHALYLALRLRTDIEAAGGLLRAGDLRLGINLGSVRWAIDVNGRPNLMGDGMNSAERVMSFAAPGEITVSRSFRDAVSCLHTSYQQLFEPMGQRADKHGRQHEVYRIDASTQALDVASASLAPASPFGAEEAAGDGRVDRADAPAGSGKLSSRRAVVATTVATALVALGAGSWFLLGRETRPPASQLPAGAGAAERDKAIAVPVAGSVSPVSRIPSETARESGDASPRLESPPAVPPEARAAVQEEPDPKPGATSLAPSRRAPARGTGALIPATGDAATPRCSFLLQKAALGEPLTPSEEKELRSSCR